MSKASEWFNRWKRPEFHMRNNWSDRRLTAYLSKYGTLVIRRSVLDKDDALRLRDWLTETFDEEKK